MENELTLKEQWVRYILKHAPDYKPSSIMAFVSGQIAATKGDLTPLLEAEAEVNILIQKTQKGFEKVFDLETE